MSDTERAELVRSGLVAEDVFDQILEMDDDPSEREFSKSIVFDFFEQASSTFDRMDTALEQRNLRELKDLGHFLKGSSATLGLVNVRDNCEKIQNCGDHKDESGSRPEPDEELCLSRIKTAVTAAKREFKDVEVVLRRFYGEGSE